jgi:hypothetical protein
VKVSFYVWIRGTRDFTGNDRQHADAVMTRACQIHLDSTPTVYSDVYARYYWDYCRGR